MTFGDLAEHAGYFRDAHKVDAYRRALGAIVHSGDVVVDLGAGTGLLGLLAAEAGAARVYMVDHGPILGVASEIAALSAYADRIVPIRAMSLDVTLPEQADVVVCDQIGGMVYDAGVLEYFRDAHDRLLRPGGAMVPGAFTLRLTPAAVRQAREGIDIWAASPAGFDTTPVHRLATNTEWRVSAGDVEARAPHADFATIDSWSVEPIKTNVEFRFEESSEIDGLVGTFVAELAAGIQVTNDPDAPDRINRWCNFYPLNSSFHIAGGDVMNVAVDLRPQSSIFTWTVSVVRAGQQVLRERHSTLLGQLLGPEDLQATVTSQVLQPTPVSRAVQDALSRIDGVSSVDTIIEETLDKHPDAFPSVSRGQMILRHQLTKWARGGS